MAYIIINNILLKYLIIAFNGRYYYRLMLCARSNKVVCLLHACLFRLNVGIHLDYNNYLRRRIMRIISPTCVHWNLSYYSYIIYTHAYCICILYSVHTQSFKYTVFNVTRIKRKRFDGVAFVSYETTAPGNCPAALEFAGRGRGASDNHERNAKIIHVSYWRFFFFF